MAHGCTLIVDVNRGIEPVYGWGPDAAIEGDRLREPQAEKTPPGGTDLRGMTWRLTRPGVVLRVGWAHHSLWRFPAGSAVRRGLSIDVARAI